jgi:hypothetical protein
VWLIILSDQLPVFALVGFYPTNKLIGRGLLLKRALPEESSLWPQKLPSVVLSGISSAFAKLSPSQGQIVHVLLTRSPLYSRTEVLFLARLACVKHAASVRSEPGSNSPLKGN